MDFNIHMKDGKKPKIGMNDKGSTIKNIGFKGTKANILEQHRHKKKGVNKENDNDK